MLCLRIYCFVMLAAMGYASERRKIADHATAGVPRKVTGVIMTNECFSFNADKYICRSPQAYLSMMTIHQWYQVFDNNSYIGAIPHVIGKETWFQIKLEKFDNNTDVFSLLKSPYGDITTKKNRIRYIDIGVRFIFKIQKYTSSKYVHFNCQNYTSQTTYSQVGLIDKTENNITTLNTTILEKKFTMIDNGTILCCLNYVVKSETDDIQTIHRFVENKTLLVYDETSSFDDTDAAHNISYFTIFIIVTVLIVLVLLITIILLKKCCFAKKQPQTILNPVEPFYLNMLFRKECQQEIEAEEHYEEIN